MDHWVLLLVVMGLGSAYEKNGKLLKENNEKLVIDKISSSYHTSNHRELYISLTINSSFFLPNPLINFSSDFQKGFFLITHKAQVTNYFSFEKYNKPSIDF